MNVVAFVQARLGSTRLPAKVLAPLGGEASLVRIVERLRAVEALDDVVVVVPVGARDEPLRELCRSRSIPFAAGPEHDVLARYHAAIAAWPCDLLLRITGDCPLVDPDVIESLLELAADSGADYASVATGALPPRPGFRRFPDGLDAEVATAAALETAFAEAADPYEREHVMPFLWRRPERFSVALLEAPEDLGRHRWTVDRPEDLAFVQTVYERLGPEPFGWRDVLALLEREPGLEHLAEG
jgi:spore coat polysaccharide biosynthesis protein SpsF